MFHLRNGAGIDLTWLAVLGGMIAIPYYFWSENESSSNARKDVIEDPLPSLAPPRFSPGPGKNEIGGKKHPKRRRPSNGLSPPPPPRQRGKNKSPKHRPGSDSKSAYDKQYRNWYNNHFFQQFNQLPPGVSTPPGGGSQFNIVPGLDAGNLVGHRPPGLPHIHAGVQHLNPVGVTQGAPPGHQALIGAHVEQIFPNPLLNPAVHQVAGLLPPPSPQTSPRVENNCQTHMDITKVCTWYTKDRFQAPLVIIILYQVYPSHQHSESAGEHIIHWLNKRHTVQGQTEKASSELAAQFTQNQNLQPDNSRNPQKPLSIQHFLEQQELRHMEYLKHQERQDAQAQSVVSSPEKGVALSSAENTSTFRNNDAGGFVPIYGPPTLPHGLIIRSTTERYELPKPSAFLDKLKAEKEQVASNLLIVEGERVPIFNSAEDQSQKSQERTSGVQITRAKPVKLSEENFANSADFFLTVFDSLEELLPNYEQDYRQVLRGYQRKQLEEKDQQQVYDQVVKASEQLEDYVPPALSKEVLQHDAAGFVNNNEEENSFDVNRSLKTDSLLQEEVEAGQASAPQRTHRNSKTDANIPIYSLDPFYGPRLSRIDAIFFQMKLDEDQEGCREQVVCNMYKNPDVYTPLSDFLSRQLTVTLEELQKPQVADERILRFFRYLQAARTGQDGGDCQIKYSQCAQDTTRLAHKPILDAFHKVSGLMSHENL
ncbi:hypothetical protein HAZT_HAZT010401 [Hyalella azteca]|uniref:Uncharacterized protein n=1 Tax=Hyalella azteca TaxID=294128 RepID=A0A6A0GTH8_HYAAZ|nr:hypothetical protein HAZT_HAZT010401 [Hyalella azteca]